MQLYIANKNYSSWSLRAWLAMRQADIPFEEVQLRLTTESDSPFKRALASVAPAGKVPVLVVDDGDGSDGDGGSFAVWDTLAIAEYLAETFPDRSLWPAHRRQRARARSLCAEMHAGFQALRQHCPMNIEAELHEVGPRLVHKQPGVRADLDRIVEMWRQCLEQSGGPFLFAGFGIVDAYFAPVASRIRTYNLPVAPDIAAFVARVHALPSMQAWCDAARSEHDFIADDEPYRSR